MTEPAHDTTPTSARPCECDNAARLAAGLTQDEARDRAIEAATTRQARRMYRGAARLDELTETDWRSVRAIVTPIVDDALEAAKEATR